MSSITSTSMQRMNSQDLSRLGGPDALQQVVVKDTSKLLSDSSIIRAESCEEKKPEGREAKKEYLEKTASKVHVTSMAVSLCEYNTTMWTFFPMKTAVELIHVKKSREMILKGMSFTKGKAFGMGFGPLEPTEAIVKHFDSLTLADYDENTVKSVINSIPEPLRKKIDPKAKDLTNGLFEKIEKFVQELVTRVNNGTCSAEQFAKEILQELAKVTETHPDSTGLGEIVEGDCSQEYVISSLVMTQLSENIMEYIKKAYEKCFGEKEKDILFNAKFCLVYEAFRSRLYTTYLADLSRVVKPNGIIYFSDTFSLHVEDKLGTLISDNVIERITILFEVFEKQTWYWQIAPNMSYSVNAYLLQPKPKQLS